MLKWVLWVGGGYELWSTSSVFFQFLVELSDLCPQEIWVYESVLHIGYDDVWSFRSRFVSSSLSFLFPPFLVQELPIVSVNF